MAANMKAVKLRIKSVQSTMQITKAMELVASSKLRKAKERAEVCRPYFRTLHSTLKDIAVNNTDFSSVYAAEARSEKFCYVVIAGDRGDAAGGGALQRVDHDEQLHEIVVHRGAGGLDHEHVAAADRLVQGDEDLPVGEGTDLRLAQFGSHQLADLLRQLRIRVAGKHLDVLAVRNHCLNALFLCSECSWFLSVGSIS